MSNDKDDTVYSTADFRKSIGMAFGRVYHGDKIVRVQNHSRPYVAIVPDKAANVIEAIQKPEPTYDEMEGLLRAMNWEPSKLEAFSELLQKRLGRAKDQETDNHGTAERAGKRAPDEPPRPVPSRPPRKRRA